MHTMTTDYRERKPESRRELLNRGYWVHDIPRPILRCRWFGHKPVVDGYDSRVASDSHRWIACDRCGERPEPQGSLDPARWDLGEPYTGTFNGGFSAGAVVERWPGPWPKSTFEFHCQLVLGGGYGGFGAQLKIGNCGSENALGGHLHLGRLFGIYWSTGDLGRGIQRRLNPTGYESKIFDLSAHDGRLSWKVWAGRNGDARRLPRWRDGSIRYRLLDIVLGPKRYEYEDIGEAVTATLGLPHGDRYDLKLQLRRRSRGRKRTRSRFDGWDVESDAPRGGIPTKPGYRRGTVHGSAVSINTANPASSAWALEALEQVRNDITSMRTRYDYAPSQEGTDR